MEADTIDNAELLEYNIDYTIEDKNLVLKEADTAKSLIYIFRDTPTEPIVSFNDSSILKADDLNVQNVQQSYILVELSDYLILHKISTETINFVKEAVDITTLNKQEAQEAALKAAQEAESSKNSADSSALYAQQAQQSSTQASDYAQQAQQSSLAVAPEAYDPEKEYNFPDVVAYVDGQTYRCVGENVIGENPDTSNNWVRIAGIVDGFWEIDLYGNLMSTEYPTYSPLFTLDTDGNIIPR